MKKNILFVVSFLFIFSSAANAADCLKQKTIEWIIVGETDKPEFNNKKSSVVVKAKDSNEIPLDFYMNLDDEQGRPILGILTSALALGLKVTLRNADNHCNSFDQVVIHAP